MRARVIKMIATAVTVAVLVLGVPSMVIGGLLVWRIEENRLESQTQSLANSVQRHLNEGATITEGMVSRWNIGGADYASIYVRISLPDGHIVIAGEPQRDPVQYATVITPAGATVRTQVSAWPAIRQVAILELVLGLGIVASLGAGWWLALRGSRQISAPLIYLAAQAEQIGSGQVRASVPPSGIEEIDLVQAELQRTGQRMAGRLAAERQHAANASHQLRTPLTALSMRLEEITLISTDDAVTSEANACLEQVERLTRVIEDLMRVGRELSGNTEAVHILEVFNSQREEWELSFENAGRELIFTDEAAQPVLADPGVLGQILATLIENSLRYGAGTTRVICRKGTSSRAVKIDVSDEGEGVADDMVETIFTQGVSGHGSTGIGLALAKSLAESIGARLELSVARPPVFSLQLAALPPSLDPDIVMPKSALVSVGRRRRQF